MPAWKLWTRPFTAGWRKWMARPFLTAGRLLPGWQRLHLLCTTPRELNFTTPFVTAET